MTTMPSISINFMNLEGPPPHYKEIIICPCSPTVVVPFAPPLFAPITLPSKPEIKDKSEKSPTRQKFKKYAVYLSGVCANTDIPM